MNPLPLAIVKGHDEIAIILIESGADVTAKNKVTILYSCTVDFIHIMVLTDSIHTHNNLTHYSHHPLSQMGITPLLLAVDMNREDIAFKLIDAGADLFAKNKVRNRLYYSIIR